MSNSWLILSNLIWLMVYDVLYASIICPACDVTAWVRERQQYSGHGKVPPTRIYVASKDLAEIHTTWDLQS